MPLPSEIDWESPIKLVDRPGLAEQYHLFDAESALAIRAALAARRPLLVRGEPGVGKTQLAAAACACPQTAARDEGRRLADRIARPAVGVRCDHAPGGCPDRCRIPLREGFSEQVR